MSVGVRDPSGNRADVVSLLVVAAVTLTMAIGAFDGRRLRGLSWIDRLAMLAAAHPSVSAIALLIAVLVVFFGSPEDELSIVGRAALVLGAAVGVVLAGGCVAKAWDQPPYGGGWALRLGSIAQPVSAAVVASLAAWLAFRGVIIGDGDAGAGNRRSRAGAAGGADFPGD